MNREEICLNIFNKPANSDRGLIEFGRWLYRMYSLNNSTGIYTARMAELLQFLNAFSHTKSDIYDERGTQKSQTSAVEDFLSDLIENIRTEERLVAYVALGKKTPMYIDIFPHGLTEFNEMSRDSVRTVLDRLILMGDKYLAQLGANFKAIFVTAKADFIALRDDQQDSIGDISTKVSTKVTQREDYTVKLMSQYLLFCSEHVNNQEHVLKFFKFSIFTKHQHHHKDYVEIKAEIDANDTLMLSDEMKITDKLEIISYCDHTITICAGNDGESTCSGGIHILPRATVKVDFSALANAGDNFLKGTNTDLVNKAKITIRIYS